MFKALFHAANVQVDFLLIFSGPIERRPESGDVAAVFVGLAIIRGRRFPSNVVFRLLFNEPDPLEHIRDIVDAPFLYMQLFHSCSEH